MSPESTAEPLREQIFLPRQMTVPLRAIHFVAYSSGISESRVAESREVAELSEESCHSERSEESAFRREKM